MLRAKWSTDFHSQRLLALFSEARSASVRVKENNNNNNKERFHRQPELIGPFQPTVERSGTRFRRLQKLQSHWVHGVERADEMPVVRKPKKNKKKTTKKRLNEQN